MMRSARSIVGLALLPLAACALRPPGAQTGQTAPTHLSAADLGFVRQATAAGAAQLQEAQLAVERAQRPVVKQFAQQMVADYGSLDPALGALAQRKGVATSAQPDGAAASEIGELEQARAGFDAVYVRAQLAAQQQAVALFQQEADGGADPDVKAFAQQNLALVQQHLAMVEALDGQPVADRL
jgi:putative membrane protein